MSARRTILRELRKRQDEGTDRYMRPASIPGFAERPGRYQDAVNRLLQERLINGTKDEEGRLAITLNAHRIGDVHKELRPWFARPATWMVIVLMAVVAAGIALRA